MSMCCCSFLLSCLLLVPCPGGGIFFDVPNRKEGSSEPKKNQTNKQTKSLIRCDRPALYFRDVKPFPRFYSSLIIAIGHKCFHPDRPNRMARSEPTKFMTK